MTILTILTVGLLFSSMAVLAQGKTSQADKGLIGNVPEGKHINAFRVDNIVGSRVINLEGQPIGTINDLVIDINTGNIVYAALEFGGVMGFGDKLFAVPWHSLTSVPSEGTFILDQSKAKLEKAPGFNKSEWPDVGDRRWRAGISAFYRHHAPYHQTSAAPAPPQKQEMRHPYLPHPGYPEGAYPGVWGDVFGQVFNPNTMDTVTGEILKIDYYEGVILTIYTDAKKPVLAVLGPTGYFEGQEKTLKPGDKVTVTGSRVIVDDTPYLIASNIREGNEEMQIRDKEGYPIWMGWRKIK